MFKLFGIFALFVASTAYATSDTSDRISEKRRSPFIGVQTTDTTAINIQLGDSEYSIPANYFDFQPDPRCNARAALFRVLFPAVEPRSKDNKQLFDVVGNKRTAGSILLTYGKHTNPGYPFEGALGRMLRGGYLRDLGSYEMTGIEHGIMRFASTGGGAIRSKIDVYSDNVENPSRFITCKLPGSVPSPGCDIYFYYRSALIKAHFSRELLPEWKTIESSINAKLASFYVAPVKKPKPNCQDTFGD